VESVDASAEVAAGAVVSGVTEVAAISADLIRMVARSAGRFAGRDPTPGKMRVDRARMGRGADV
jgi:hypothetical protein